MMFRSAKKRSFEESFSATTSPVVDGIKSGGAVTSRRQYLHYLRLQVLQLRAERIRLIKLVEECSTASILLGLGAKKEDEQHTIKPDHKVEKTEDKDQKSVAAVENVETPTLSSKAIGIGMSMSPKALQKSQDNNEDHQRKRLRAQAKLTRERHRIYTTEVEKVIAKLEDENKRIKRALFVPLLLKKKAIERKSFVPSLAAVPKVEEIKASVLSC
mmetsp:Transcript_11826/g.18642  ORF Transcript_11826/g.18642 Transcript_11826/m.18642 type:complete len:215 (+) Transcript_11826:137-781(+)